MLGFFVFGVVMPFDPHERDEVDRLWSEHNAAAKELRDQQIRLRLFEERLERMSNDAASSNGRVALQLDHLSEGVQALRDSILTMQVQKDTQGGLVDRWLPMIISLVAVLVAAKDFFV